jgi:hypothetical protein
VRQGFAIILIVATLAGCAVGPSYREPKQSVPDQFGNASQPSIGEGEVSAQFWTLLNDPVLDRLVSDALAANKDLAQAAGNLQASRAAARLTGFDAYPTVTAGGSYQRTRLSSQQLPGATVDQRTVDTYDVGFDAAWELDFFGRVRRAKEASRAEAGAAEATLRDAIVSVTAEVARNYCVLRGLQDQLAVAERNEVNQRQTLQLTQTRLDAGRGTQLDVARAAAQLATTESTIPPLRISIATTIHRLSVLTGRQPNELAPQLSASQPMPTLPALNSIGGPEALLRRRPDVRVGGTQPGRRNRAHRRVGRRSVSADHVDRLGELQRGHVAGRRQRGLAILFAGSQHHVGGVRSRPSAGTHPYRARRNRYRARRVRGCSPECTRGYGELARQLRRVAASRGDSCTRRDSEHLRRRDLRGSASKADSAIF